MKRLKKIESVVLDALQTNKRARSDDFILYGAVLKRLGVDLTISLSQFLSFAKSEKMPSFESVSRCRRHLQELNTELQDNKTAVAREKEQDKFKTYNISGVGEECKN